MRVPAGRFLLLVVIGLGGCATATHRAGVVRGLPDNGWEGKANLTLEQISPEPQLKGPATRPDARPPVMALALYGEARDHVLRGETTDAVEALQRAIAIDPFRFQLRYDLGWAYLNEGNADDSAIEAFEKAALLEPDHLRLQTELGQLYLARSNVTAAIDHLRLATHTTEYATEDGQAALADLLLAKALKDSGYDRAALNQYTILLRRFEHPSLSLQENPELAARLQGPDSLFVQIGELLERHGEYAQAISAFQPAVDREPDNFQLQSRYARDLALDNRRDQALDKAVDLIVRDRATPQTLQVLHEVCTALGLEDGEVETLKKLSASRPGDQAVLFALSDTLIANGRLSEARQLLQSAWEKSPGDIALTRRLFTLDKRDNLVEIAARRLIHALAVNPDAVTNYSPLWDELLRPGQPHRLKVPMLMAMTVPAGDESAWQFWIANTANQSERPGLETSALESATLHVPPFAPAYRSLLQLEWNRTDLNDQQKLGASDHLISAAKAGGDVPLSLELTGQLLLIQKKLPEAIDAFSRALKAGGSSPALQLALAEAAVGSGQDSAFERLMWKLISEHPLYEDAYLTLFQYYTDPAHGTAEQAMKVLATWLTNDPQSVAARIWQIKASIGQGLVQDADAQMTRLFADDPEDPAVFQTMHQVYRQTDRIDVLIGKLEDRHASKPRDTDIVDRLVLLYSEQNRAAEGVRLLDSTRGLVADDPDLLYSLTEGYQQLNQKQTATDILQQIVQLDPNHAGASNDLGFEWADQGKNLPEAEKLIRAAVSAEPDNPAFLDSLGWVLYKLGNFGEARKYLQQAVGPSDAADPVVLDHLGDTLYRLSKPQDARQTWQWSLKELGDTGTASVENEQLRLQLMQKIKQVETSKPVDVSPVPQS